KMKKNFFASRAAKILALVPPSNESDFGSDSDDDVEKVLEEKHFDVINNDLDYDSSNPLSLTESCDELEDIINEALAEPIEHIAFDLETNELLGDEQLGELPYSVNTSANIESVPQSAEKPILVIVPPSDYSSASLQNSNEYKNASSFSQSENTLTTTRPTLNSSLPATARVITRLQKNEKIGKSINVTKNDIKDFIAIEILMGVIKMPSYCDYWSNNLRYSKIADIMTLKRFQQIRRFLHFVNNEDVNQDRYFKIRPFLDIIRNNCLSMPQERRFSIDEMMIPYKGTMAGSRRQYIKNKPKKWGFKVFVRAGITGFVYDFLLYSGEDTFRQIDFTEEEQQFGLGGKVVIALSKTTANLACSVLYFDNFFSSFELLVYLRQCLGLFSLGTLRSNRIRDCKLEDDKSLKNRGRGSFSQQVSNELNAKLAVVKWFDNKAVLLVSSFTDAYPISSVKRYRKEDKRRVDVPCPQIVLEYNQHMGGVDLADMFVALYRTGMKSKRWYLGIFSQFLDICINNSWILYKEDFDHNPKQSKKKMALKDFRIMIAEGLLQKNRIRGRPSNLLKSTENRPNRSPITTRPCMDMQYDAYGHFPVFSSARGR
ncbi:piggyBac transposable element-derived protein 3-like, partial [Anoplophora glabripennis]|uniref:piggyBac transposable element-derived protein 3-like n=1 Tax=Anoplophora glabripennis TaxID=217634 RepID=UPI000C764901